MFDCIEEIPRLISRPRSRRRQAYVDSFLKAISLAHLNIPAKYAEISAIEDEIEQDRDLIEAICSEALEKILSEMRLVHSLPVLAMYAYNGCVDDYARAFRISASALLKVRNNMRHKCTDIIKKHIPSFIYID